MKFRTGLLVWAGCFALFMAGVTWAAAYTSASFALLKDSLEVCSFMATILAAGVAVVTLTSWRDQWKHTESYETLKRLNIALGELACVDQYLRTYANYVLARRDSVAEADGLEEVYRVNLENWKIALREFRYCAEDANSLFISKEFPELLAKPESLGKRVGLVAKEIIFQTYGNGADHGAGKYALGEVLQFQSEIHESKQAVKRLRSKLQSG